MRQGARQQKVINVAERIKRKYVADLLNVPGPFYVVGGGCLTCCLPEAEAPDLIGFRDDGKGQFDSSCFFKMQPQTPDEVSRALKAMQFNCVATVSYAGQDRGYSSAFARTWPGKPMRFPVTYA